MIEREERWQPARVVYGDTDSLFIALPHRPLAEAFRLGHEIAAAITASCPAPMAIKFEKVYWPSCLITKKRYCGYRYEQAAGEPCLEVKGMETVRRDGCPLTAKILEKTLKYWPLPNL